LSGVYNQILVDGLPVIQGLTYTYGTGTIPGSMLEQIWVVKGANSVLQGFEPMVGQITIFPREGGTAEPYTADVLVNSFGEKHLNAATAIKKKQWTNYLALHASLPGGKWDRDDDGFRDLPKLTRYSFYNKLRFRKENELGWSAFAAVRFIDEERIGGQTAFDAKTEAGTTRAYGQIVQFRQPEFLSKSGYRLNENNKISLLASYTGQNQDSWFGLTHYQAQQRAAYANLQYELFWGKAKAHELKAGMSMRHFVLDETIAFAAADTLKRSYAGNYLRKENTPGLFAEQVLHLDGDRWVVVTGIRADQHQDFGWRVVPRALLRFTPNPSIDLRINVGTGWRTVQLFPENIGLLTGNRDIIFQEELRPEAATNYGMSMTKRWNLKNTKYSVSGDLYHTRFSNQFFPDYDTDASKAFIANYTGKSVSNAAQLEGSFAWKRLVEVRAAYSFIDVYRGSGAEKRVLPFNPKHKLLGVLTYRTPGERWQFDANLHYYGQQRLPDTRKNLPALQRPDYADAYTLCSMQARYSWAQFSLFGGCENLFDFRQKRPLLGWEQPFAPGFDPAFAWGPTRGREFYLGMTYRSKAR
jgi:outer membrane receptor for ferrienterochelin and colicins